MSVASGSSGRATITQKCRCVSSSCVCVDDSTLTSNVCWSILIGIKIADKWGEEMKKRESERNNKKTEKNHWIGTGRFEWGVRNGAGSLGVHCPWTWNPFSWIKLIKIHNTFSWNVKDYVSRVARIPLSGAVFIQNAVLRLLRMLFSIHYQVRQRPTVIGHRPYHHHHNDCHCHRRRTDGN